MYSEKWMDNIKTWTGFSVEESVRRTDDRDKWRKYVLGVANRAFQFGKKVSIRFSLPNQFFRFDSAI